MSEEQSAARMWWFAGGVLCAALAGCLMAPGRQDRYAVVMGDKETAIRYDIQDGFASILSESEGVYYWEPIRRAKPAEAEETDSR